MSNDEMTKEEQEAMDAFIEEFETSESGRINDKEVVELYRGFFESIGVDTSTIDMCFVTEDMMCWYDTDGEYHVKDYW